jgi:light-harvesting complex 1 beta chain
MLRTTDLQKDFSPANETSAFWTFFAVSFGLLFVFALTAKLMGLHWRTLLPGAENSPGLVRGVKTAVYTLMSRIV